MELLYRENVLARTWRRPGLCCCTHLHRATRRWTFSSPTDAWRGTCPPAERGDTVPGPGMCQTCVAPVQTSGEAFKGAFLGLLGPRHHTMYGPDTVVLGRRDRKTKRKPETQRKNGQKRDGQIETHTHRGSPGERAQQRGRQKRRGKERKKGRQDRGRHADRDLCSGAVECTRQEGRTLEPRRKPCVPSLRDGAGRWRYCH